MRYEYSGGEVVGLLIWGGLVWLFTLGVAIPIFTKCNSKGGCGSFSSGCSKLDCRVEVFVGVVGRYCSFDDYIWLTRSIFMFSVLETNGAVSLLCSWLFGLCSNSVKYYYFLCYVC